MNMIIIFYICILVDLFFIHLLLYLNLKRLNVITEILTKLQNKFVQIKPVMTNNKPHPADEHPFFEPKINRDKE